MIKIDPIFNGFFVKVYGKNFFIPSEFIPNLIGEEDSETSYIKYINSKNEVFKISFFKNNDEIKGSWMMNGEKKDFIFHDSTIIYSHIDIFMNGDSREISYQEIKNKVSKYLEINNIQSVVFEITGRTSSYVLGKILCDCLGKNNVLGVNILYPNSYINDSLKRTQMMFLDCKLQTFVLKDDSLLNASNKFLRLQILELCGDSKFGNNNFVIVSDENLGLGVCEPLENINKESVGKIYQNIFSSNHC